MLSFIPKRIIHINTITTVMFLKPNIVYVLRKRKPIKPCVINFHRLLEKYCIHLMSVKLQSFYPFIDRMKKKIKNRTNFTNGSSLSHYCLKTKNVLTVKWYLSFFF